MKTILLCRHAKSSWKDLSLADRDRPLNKRGKRNVPEMGRRLAERGITPDAVISSPAVRAVKTANRLVRELGFPKKNIQVRPAIYETSPTLLLALIRNLPETQETVILVGHNPEFTTLANILGNLHIINVPTCGIVALEFCVNTWEEIMEGKGSLVFFDYPKKDAT